MGCSWALALSAVALLAMMRGAATACSTGAPAGSPPATSVFALVAASKPSCLASKHALCTPKFEMTIDSACAVSMRGLPSAGYFPAVNCAWVGTAEARGDALQAVTDLTPFTRSWWIGSLLSGNITATPGGPYLHFYISKIRCNLTYRALTTPAAALLGVAPAPCPPGTPGCRAPLPAHPLSPPGRCPAGHYLETATDALPGPCLACPPGTYHPPPTTANPDGATIDPPSNHHISSSSSSSSAAASHRRMAATDELPDPASDPASGAPPSCLRCPAGTYAPGYGATSCKRCPPPMVSPRGSAACQLCGAAFPVPVGVDSCEACRPNSAAYYTPMGTCLGNNYGSPCCASGACGPHEPRCPPALPSMEGAPQVYPAVLQLVATHLQHPSCRKATFLSCLQPGALMSFTANSGFPSAELQSVDQPSCVSKELNAPFSLFGGYASPSRAHLSHFDTVADDAVGYELLSSAAASTLTVTMARAAVTDNSQLQRTPQLTPCWARFRLLAGYAFDLAPPPGARCPGSSKPMAILGRSFCQF